MSNLARAVVILLIVVIFASGGFFAYSSLTPKQSLRSQGGVVLSSSAFTNNSRIPVRYTCDGADLSPSLSWTRPPEATRALAVIMEDPDAPSGTFTHWILFNMPSDLTALDENVPKQAIVTGVGLQGTNGFDTVGYQGPCPPPGSMHHYRITLYALDALINLGSGSTKEEVLKASEGHVLATGELIGVYGR